MFKCRPAAVGVHLKCSLLVKTLILTIAIIPRDSHKSTLSDAVSGPAFPADTKKRRRMPTLWCGSTDEAVCPKLQRTGVLFLLLTVRSRLLLKGFIMMAHDCTFLLGRLHCSAGGSCRGAGCVPQHPLQGCRVW